MNKKYFKLLIISVIFLILPLVQVQANVPAPLFSLPGTQGKVNLEDHIGKIVYLDFWASWCGPCRESFPWMKQITEKYKDQGLVVIAVNLDREMSDAIQFIKRETPNFLVAYDPSGSIAKTYKLRGMPSSFIIGRDGKIKYSHKGFLSYKIPKIEAQLKELIKPDSEKNAEPDTRKDTQPKKPKKKPKRKFLWFDDWD